MNLEEAQAYIRVLLCIAKADGIISGPELKYIKAFASSRGITTIDVEAMASEVNESEPKLETSLEKICDETGKDLLRSILVLGYADGNYSEPEKRAYTYISGYFDMKKVEVQTIEEEVINDDNAMVEDDSFKKSLEKIDNVIDDKSRDIAKHWIWNLDRNDKSSVFGCSVDELIDAWNL